MAYFELSKKVLKEYYKKLEPIADIIAYNLKSNEVVGKVLEAETGCQFTISSINSINTIKDKKRIIYILQGEEKKEVEKIFNSGIHSFIVDNPNDLKNVVTLNKKVTLFLRMKFKEHTVYTGKYFVYGFSWQDTNKLIKELSKNKNIELGIHFHRKTQNIGEWNLAEEFFEAIEEENFKHIKIINIGGGIPIEYVNSMPDTKAIMASIKDFKTKLNKLGVKLMVEPGRFLAAPGIRLHSKIKNIYDNNIILDCSIYNAYFDTYLFHMRLMVLDENKGKEKYLLKGMSPDSLDIFRYSIMLPKKKIGDYITFLNAGAYNFYSEFNNMDKIETKIVNDFKK
ncbi:MAG: decarboxylase [Candidatus ainarchaeum sp.]|nr:decarboxylase [Candidatus ainarchaeum sp.]